MLRADRTAAEWKNVACATRRRRRILLRWILFMCMSDGVLLLTVLRIRKVIFPAVSLPENPAKK